MVQRHRLGLNCHHSRNRSDMGEIPRGNTIFRTKTTKFIWQWRLPEVFVGYKQKRYLCIAHLERILALALQT